MGHMASFEPLNENKWLGFEEKLMGNFSIIAGDLDHPPPPGLLNCRRCNSPNLGDPLKM
jgi:hypothetical protein